MLEEGRGLCQRPRKRSEFDPFYVGFREMPECKKQKLAVSVSLLNTHFPGNSNQGHEYGTWMNHQERLDLVEFLKTL